jgi:hypothetical protein
VLAAAYDWLRAQVRYRVVMSRLSDVVKGYLALALHRTGEAEQHFQAGLEWCERNRCPIEGGRCHLGLAEVAAARGDRVTAAEELDAAGELFAPHGARLFLEQVRATRQRLQT